MLDGIRVETSFLCLYLGSNLPVHIFADITYKHRPRFKRPAVRLDIGNMFNRTGGPDWSAKPAYVQIYYLCCSEAKAFITGLLIVPRPPSVTPAADNCLLSLALMLTH